MSMKRNILAVVFVVAALCMCACGSKKSQITYSNLTGAESIGTLEKLLAGSGVPQENSDKVISSVKNYNETIGSELLSDKGVLNFENPIGQYDEGAIDEKWQA